jgi:hypothetical protein
VDGVDIGEEIAINGDPMGFYRVRFLTARGPAVRIGQRRSRQHDFTNPAGIEVVLSVSGVNVLSSTYSVNFGAATAFTNGTRITVGAGLTNGQASHADALRHASGGVSANATYGYTFIDNSGAPMTHVGGTHHWVSDENQVFINSAGYPEGASVEAYIVYCINPPCEGDWPLVAMNRIPTGRTATGGTWTSGSSPTAPSSNSRHHDEGRPAPNSGTTMAEAITSSPSAAAARPTSPAATSRTRPIRRSASAAR